MHGLKYETRLTPRTKIESLETRLSSLKLIIGIGQHGHGADLLKAATLAAGIRIQPL